MKEKIKVKNAELKLATPIKDFKLDFKNADLVNKKMSENMLLKDKI